MSGLVGFAVPKAIAFLADPKHAGLGVIVTFVLGAMIGSFLNVCIYRLPLEKSILWPTVSHCGRCYQPIHWYDNIPLISYWVLRGRCRVCGARFSVRYFFVELLTAAALGGLFELEVVRNIHQFDPGVLGGDRALNARLAVFGFHGLLVCLLIVATFCDLDHQIIPLPLTICGTLFGLIGSLVWPWPWPYTEREVLGGLQFAQMQLGWGNAFLQLRQGLYAWPVWGPPPAFLGAPGSRSLGLATGLAGALVGTLLLRGVRFFYGLGNPEHTEETEPELEHAWIGRRVVSWFQRVGGKALGIGDADLMMMAGAFVGWQPVLAGFFIGTFLGLFHGILHLVSRGNRPFAFGPSLAGGVVIAFLCWRWIGPHLQVVFFNPQLMAILLAIWPALLLAALLVRLVRLAGRRLRHAGAHDPES